MKRSFLPPALVIAVIFLALLAGSLILSAAKHPTAASNVGLTKFQRGV
jgi:hypothetical protein